ncbi:HD domain-containing protein [Caproicibacter sp.]|uniref:HD domain-containing protein n=1 Tax=Caproicibacter sp. TaxID=2814884 RepID=UPI003988DC45
MEYSVSRLISEMLRCNAGDPRRIQHALKVYAFSKAIGGEEGLSPARRKVLEAAAVLHDIGIHESERKYGSSAGRYQELEGPPVARELLKPFDLPTEFTDRVCYLIGHHHTYDGIDGIDYQILVEADFLVNLYEDGCTREAARSALERIFKTETGKGYLKSMFFTE